MEGEMSNLLKLGAAVLLVLAVEGRARADMVGFPDAPPAFNAKEAQFIARNATLRSLKDSDPWLVRRALDAIAKVPANADTSQPPPDRNSDPDLDRLKASPDLDVLRTSPEALNDLFQVFKAAAERRAGSQSK
jgi:hypothetical protein